MKKVTLLALCLAWATNAYALKTGDKAPDFSAESSKGKVVKLSDYKGKTVVLEWLNHGCPFVRKHYDSKNMQNLQNEYTKKGVVWLSVISSRPGAQGHVTKEDAEKDKEKYGSHASAILLDEKGTLGKLYGAKTTPHMFVIDEDGALVYQGAIDDKPSTDTDDIKGATNYVSDALNAVMAKPERKPVKVAQTKSYGCSVKY